MFNLYADPSENWKMENGVITVEQSNPRKTGWKASGRLIGFRQKLAKGVVETSLYLNTCKLAWRLVFECFYHQS